MLKFLHDRRTRRDPQYAPLSRDTTLTAWLDSLTPAERADVSATLRAGGNPLPKHIMEIVVDSRRYVTEPAAA